MGRQLTVLASASCFSMRSLSESTIHLRRFACSVMGRFKDSVRSSSEVGAPITSYIAMGEMVAFTRSTDRHPQRREVDRDWPRQGGGIVL